MHDDPTVVALVARARAGDQSAWNAIVERYSPLVWALCRRYRLARPDIDDVGAAVWLRLVERLDTLREPAALPGWLATTIHRECLHLLRHQTRQVPVDADTQIFDNVDASADEWLLAQERQIALRSAFAGLSARCQQLLTMLFGDPPAGYADAGAALGLAVGAVGPMRQRCLERLRTSPELSALSDSASKVNP